MEPGGNRIILAPPSLLDLDDENALQHILDITSEEEFDFEFGEGDREAGDDADDDWVATKISEIEGECDEYEKRLLGAVLRPGERIPATTNDYQANTIQKPI